MANDFELPSSNEKLSSKFIMDALSKKGAPPVVEGTVREQVAEEQKPENQLEFAACGTADIASAGAEEPPVVDMPMEMSDEASYSGVDLPKGKKYFRIGEVADLIGVEPHVLRYWESEFKSVKPSKTGSGQRVYAKKDVETLHYIRHLLHVEKFSIKGAKKKLNERKRHKTVTVPVSDVFWEKRSQRLKVALHEVKEIIQLLRHELSA